ncbi:polysaccharide lyase 6 family protein [Microlunatus sp. Y2014]|uniref:polysaccharide lyase 6 family protein n=1 Tax=Microlunatus sp. Y2014 TaxID=3418488 RepID=UPI003DA76699
MSGLSRRQVIGVAGTAGLAMVAAGASAVPAHAVDHFVDTRAELDAAIAAAQPGDTITMANGAWADMEIVLRTSGTAAAPITLRAETRGGVHIIGTSYLQLVGDHLVVDGLRFRDGAAPLNHLHLIEFRGVEGGGYRHANNCRLTNVLVDRYNKAIGEGGKDVWVGLFGADHEIDHCSFIGKTSESVLMIGWRATGDPNRWHIHHNYFSDIPNNGLSAAALAIRLGDGNQALTDSDSIIEYNLFERMEGIGRIVSLKCSNTVIRDNTFREASGSICSRAGDRNTVERNFILPGIGTNDGFYTGGMLMIGAGHVIRGNYVQGCRVRGKAALQLYEGDTTNGPGEGSYYPTKDVTFENNTFVDNDKNIIVGMYYDPAKGLDVPVEDITYRQNAILGNASANPVIETLDPPIGDIVYEDNQFFGGNLEGLEDIPGIEITDPGLVVQPDGTYRFATGSPLAGNITTEPLTTGDVGPVWEWEYVIS